ncbi:MAG TPA: hypothetical protein VF538_16625 [Pyrinomonadaceae bacterium]
MKSRLLTVCLSLAFCCACWSSASAQAVQGTPPPIPPPTPAPAAVPVAAPETAKAARAVEDVRAPQGWKRYEIQLSGGSVVSVVLPAPPQAFDQVIAVGEKYPAATCHLFAAADAQGVYMIGYVEGLPVAMTLNPAAQTSFFKGFWSGFAESVRKRLKEGGSQGIVAERASREMRIGGYRAQVQDFNIDTRAGSARAVITGGYAYMIVEIDLVDKPGEGAPAFLDSFDVRPRK